MIAQLGARALLTLPAAAFMLISLLDTLRRSLLDTLLWSLLDTLPGGWHGAPFLGPLAAARSRPSLGACYLAAALAAVGSPGLGEHLRGHLLDAIDGGLHSGCRPPDKRRIHRRLCFQG